MDKCEIYEGNIRSYRKLESIARELQQQVTEKIVDKTLRLEQFVVDFVQDATNKWYLLKIKYGKTGSKHKAQS